MMALKWALLSSGGNDNSAPVFSIPNWIPTNQSNWGCRIKIKSGPNIIDDRMICGNESGLTEGSQRSFKFAFTNGAIVCLYGRYWNTNDWLRYVITANTEYDLLYRVTSTQFQLWNNATNTLLVSKTLPNRLASGSVCGKSVVGRFATSSIANQAPTGVLYYNVDFIDYENPANTRNYDADLSGGTGTIFPTTQGTNNGTQSGNWPSNNDEWFQYEAGGGGAIITGGGVSTFAINDIGGGNVLRRGGAVDNFSVSSTGNGRVTFAGGSSDNFSFTGAGGGNVLRRGGAADTFSFTVVGGGEVINGAVTVTGGAAITFSVGAVGGGAVLRRGGGVDTITVNESGGGAVLRRGGSVESFTLAASGNGRTVRIGGGTDTITVNALGSGNTIRGAGGNTGFTVNADGAGYTVRAGGSSIEFTVFASGGGDSLGQGYKPVITSPVLSLQTSSKSGSLSVIESISTNPVAVQRLLRGAVVIAGKTKRLPYNLNVKRTVRGAVCTL